MVVSIALSVNIVKIFRRLPWLFKNDLVCDAQNPTAPTILNQLYCQAVVLLSRYRQKIVY